MDLNCDRANMDLFLGTHNNVNQCCMQGRGWNAPVWDDVTDLNEWYQTFEPFVDVRNNLKNGIQDTNCKRCWNLENNNLKSFRTTANNDDVFVKRIEVRFSNKCNLQCKMCDVNSSDQIKNLVNKLKEQGIKNHFTLQHDRYTEFQNKEKVLNLIAETETVEYIILAGGEPFVMPEVEWLIDQLIARNKTDIEISFITNVTTVKPKILEKLSKFKQISIACSIDGIEETIEFQRYPARWKTIENNFNLLYKFYKNNNVRLNFSPCITQLNFLGIPKMLQWMEQFSDVGISLNLLADSSYLQYKLIPLEYRQETIELFDKIDLSRLNDFQLSKFENFFSNGCKIYRPIEAKEKEELRDHVSVWDMNPGPKTADMCPWIPELIR